MGVNILVAHGGGPTAVINTSLQGVIEAARESGKVDKIYAARFGAEGILKGDLLDLTEVPASTVAKLAHTPASAIGSCRRKLTDADYPTVIETLKKFNIGCFFYNGGNDSMDTCNKVSKLAQKEGLDVKVIGIPKTMDNDLDITDHCPGFGSAARYAGEAACELALDASGLPIHVVVLELMGRNAGWVTAASALAARATNCEVLTYLPEKLVDEDRMLSDIESAWAKGKGLLVTVSEGICGLDGKPLASTGIVDGFGHMVPGGACRRGTHFDAAGPAQLRLGADPDRLDMEPLAELRQGLRHIGVGILCQIHRPDLPGQYSLAQLLCPHQEPGSCQVRQIAGIRYSTYFFHIHTRLYYTQKFRIVNHFPKIILYKHRALPGTILTFRTISLLLCVLQKQMFPGFPVPEDLPLTAPPAPAPGSAFPPE